ncbi:hypothetical protein NCAS_0F03600 [Naumovozyma castellii]|uniref:SH3 domain-containing protein n=1 Tax=Naumovozyma castellii TaxID=27288 RepID=G0VH71_NAUCA|nr:hypothetical protein NCAS_0F03600 [Naumovozyma castellii CBS 4309]CCC70844.1 hypothetical protein NCAS_0F03600 [Naumovozyma castellii CBS 4309]
MSASSINRSLATIRTELDFLKESNVISQETFDQITSTLPVKYDPDASRAPSIHSSNNNQPQDQGNEFVEAIYPFEPQQQGDLALKPGDKIEVIEKPSPEWFKGRCNGQTGMFPSNYVKPAFSGSSGSVNKVARPNGPPQYQNSLQTQNSHTPSFQQPAPFPPALTNYYQQQQPQFIQTPQQQQPQQVQQQPVQQQQPQQQEQHHSHHGLKKFGSKLGNAAIFGAGATIGSDIVNSIF